MTEQSRTAGTLQGIALLLPVTLSVMGVLVLAPVAPMMAEQFRDVPGVAFWIPVVLTTPGLCMALFSTVVGYLGDRFGRRQLLILATFIYAAAGIAPILLNNLYAIEGTRAVVGICEAMVMTLSTALIGDFFAGHEREKWLAAQTAVASTSAIGFLLIGGVLGHLFGWRGPFGIYAVTIVLALGLIRFTWEPERPHMPADVDSVRAKFPVRRMLGICGITILASILFYTTQIQMSSALNALGVVEPARAGLFVAIASIGVPAGTFLFWRAASTPIALLLAVEFALLGASFVAMSHAGSIAGFVGAASVNQLGAGMILPTLLTWAIRQLPYAVRGRGTGLWQSVFAAGQFASGLAVPAIALRSGGLVSSFQYLGAVALCAAALSLAASVRRRGIVGGGKSEERKVVLF